MPKNDCPWSKDNSGRHVSGCGCEDTGSILGIFRKWKNTESSKDRKTPDVKPSSKPKPKSVCTSSDRQWYSTHLHLCGYQMEGHPVTHRCYCSHRWS
jgi:hypothetical protein